jgi:hypothetical protein
MPTLDGIAATREIAADPTLAGVRICEPAARGKEDQRWER